MVYMAGDNNLKEEMVFALREMIRVAPELPNIHIAVQFDAGGPPRRFIVANDVVEIPGVSKMGSLYAAASASAAQQRPERPPDRHPDARPEDADLENQGSAVREPRKLLSSQKLLEEFIEESMEELPASRYMLVLSGHGSGALGDFLAGDDGVSQLSIPALGAVLKSDLPGRINILAMDSCLMSMAEVAYEIRGAVDVMMGAEGFETNAGWPYDRVLKAVSDMAAGPEEKSTREIARAIVREYIRYYNNYTLADLSTDQSALNLDEAACAPLFSGIGNLAAYLLEKLKAMPLPDRDPDALPDPLMEAILMSHWEAQTYKEEQYVDLWDFCGRLALRSRRLGNIQLEGLCEKIQNAILDSTTGKGMVIASGYTGAASQHSHGLSLFFPWAKIEDEEGTSDLEVYRKLELAKAFKWGEFLQEYLEKSQRAARRCPGSDASARPRKSRLNRRADSRNTLEVTHRFDRPQGRFDRPQGRSMHPDLGDMKNPPIQWFPCACLENSE